MLFKWVKYDRSKSPKFIKKLIKEHGKDPKILAPKLKSTTVKTAHSLWDDNKPGVEDKEASSDKDDSTSGRTQTDS
jgi:hypothetical protein